MKRFPYIVLISLFVSGFLLAQAPSEPKKADAVSAESAKPAEEKKADGVVDAPKPVEVKKADGVVDAPKPAEVKSEPVAADKKDSPSDKKISGLAPGYGAAEWGSDYMKVKEAVKGKIIYAEEDKVIVSKDREITYRYGFFFIDPELAPNMNGAGSPSRLFYSSVEFPYLSLDDIKQKMIEKYGEPTGENIKKERGALYWDGEKTGVVVWVDAYEKKSFCRKIVYFSKDIVKELKDYKDKIFSKREADVLKNLIPGE